MGDMPQPVCRTWQNYTLSPAGAAEARLVSITHVSCSSISALCCGIVLLVSARFPSLRRFPANMLLWKTACDLVTSLVLMGINAARLQEDDNLEFGARLCADGALAGVTGFLSAIEPVAYRERFLAGIGHQLGVGGVGGGNRV